MGMWTTDNQDTLSDVLRAFSDAARLNYGSHSFEAGYLQSVIISMLPVRNMGYRAQGVTQDQIEETFQALHDLLEASRINRTVASKIGSELIRLQDMLESAMELDPVDF